MKTVIPHLEKSIVRCLLGQKECVWCKKVGKPEHFTIEHITATKLGLSCGKCNMIHGAITDTFKRFSLGKIFWQQYIRILKKVYAQNPDKYIAIISNSRFEETIYAYRFLPSYKNNPSRIDITVFETCGLFNGQFISWRNIPRSLRSQLSIG